MGLGSKLCLSIRPDNMNIWHQRLQVGEAVPEEYHRFRFSGDLDVGLVDLL